jgi:hypothetical protein
MSLPAFSGSKRVVEIGSPSSVAKRRRGLVRDPMVTSFSLLDPQWVPEGTTVSDRKRAAMIKKADRVIAVLSRFVARVVRQYRFNKLFPHANEAWANIMEKEDAEMIAENEARLRELIIMPADELREHWGYQTGMQGRCPSLMRFIRFVHQKREERAALIEENRQIWLELNFSLIGLSVRQTDPRINEFRVGSSVIQPMSVVAEWTPMSFQNIGVPVILHNPQAVAPVRRVTGRFAALDSDDE